LDHGALEVLAVIETGARRMRHLVRDLLAYSRVMHEDVDMSAVDAGQVLAEVVSDIGSHIDQADARVTHGPMPEVVADASQLRQLLQNLISNALKYHPADSRPEIDVTAEERPSEWVFAVRDNGIGIPEEYHERIFGLFKRLHRHEYPGTGVGLAICRRVVQTHGGRIWVDSKPGEGATFYFTLPKRAVKPVAVSS
jgi:chemotaxis family two-component system sensor kinase Cph1